MFTPHATRIVSNDASSNDLKVNKISSEVIENSLEGEMAKLRTEIETTNKRMVVQKNLITRYREDIQRLDEEKNRLISQTQEQGKLNSHQKEELAKAIKEVDLLTLSQSIYSECIRRLLQICNIEVTSEVTTTSLNDYMDQLICHIKAPEISIPSAPSTSEMDEALVTIANLRADISTQAAALDVLLKEGAESREEAAAWKKSFDDREELIVGMEKEIKELRDELERSRKQVEELVSALEMSTHSFAKVEEGLERRLEEMREAMAALKGELEEEKREKARERDEREKERVEREEEREKERAKEREEREKERVEREEEREKEREKEREEREKEREESERKTIQLTEAMEQQQESMRVLKESEIQTRELIEKKEIALSGLNEKLNESIREIGQLQEACVAKDDIAARLQEELSGALSSQKEATESRNEEKATWEKEESLLRSSLEQQNALLTEKDNSIQKLQVELEAQKSDQVITTDNLKSELERVRSHHKALEIEHEKILSCFKGALAETEKLQEEFRKTMEEAEHKHQSSLTEKSAENKRISSVLAEKEAECKRISVLATEKEIEFHRIAKLMIEKEAELKKMNALLGVTESRLENERSVNKICTKELEEKDQTVLELYNKLDALKQKEADLNTQVSQMNEKCQKAVKSEGEMKAALDLSNKRLLNEQSRLEAEIEKLSTNILNYQVIEKEWYAQHKTVLEEKERLEKDMEALKKSDKEEREKRDKRDKERDVKEKEKEGEMEKIVAKNAESLKKLTEATKEISSLEGEKKTLQEAVVAAKKQAEQSQFINISGVQIHYHIAMAIIALIASILSILFF